MVNKLEENISKKLSVSTPLNSAVAQSWPKILQAGLPKESKEKLLELYPPLENCPILDAPILNKEVKNAMGSGAIKKDDYRVADQKQLNAGLSALGRVLSSLIENEDLSKEILFDNLCDAGKILANLQYSLSMARRAFIIPGLDPSLKTVLEETVVDTYLFGSNFSEIVKTAKEVQKTTKDLEKSSKPSRENKNPTPKSNTKSFRASRSVFPLNSRGPPRDSSKRGGQRPQYQTSRKKISPRKYSPKK